MKITSLTNPVVKEIVKLRQRRHRDTLKLMIIEGHREIIMALNAKHSISKLFYCPPLFRHKDEETILTKCNDQHVPIIECAPNVFKKISYKENAEGLLAIASQIHHTLKDIHLKKDALILVAESVEKPGNLGTILRSSDAAGVHTVIVCDPSTDINNPNVIRASLGTIFTVPVVETSSAMAIEWLKENGIQIIAATPHAQQLYTNVDLKEKTAIVLGSEQTGLTPTWLNSTTTEVKIPMLGQVDSLNVASAATILIYEAIRQRSNQRLFV